jgi:hypothetical protein
MTHCDTHAFTFLEALPYLLCCAATDLSSHGRPPPRLRPPPRRRRARSEPPLPRATPTAHAGEWRERRPAPRPPAGGRGTTTACVLVASVRPARDPARAVLKTNARPPRPRAGPPRGAHQLRASRSRSRTRCLSAPRAPRRPRPAAKAAQPRPARPHRRRRGRASECAASLWLTPAAADGQSSAAAAFRPPPHGKR